MTDRPKLYPGHQQPAPVRFWAKVQGGNYTDCWIWTAFTRPRPDILDRIDDTLLTYDSQRATGEQPWPYRGF